MESQKLQDYIRNLAMLDESDDLFISCYLNMEIGPAGFHDYLDERMHVLKNSLPNLYHKNFKEAIIPIHDFLSRKSFQGAKGLALFSRNGSQPFFLPLEFRVPLSNLVVMDLVPHIYPLVELLDTYHSYVVVIVSENRARIIEIHTGTVTESLWIERPELRKRIGREWTKEHYQNHRNDRGQKFMKEKIKVLEKVFSQGGHTHLLLAGNPRIAAHLKKALPKHLAEKLIDTIVITDSNNEESIVAETLNTFIRQEQTESFTAVEMLKQEMNKNGLGVVGTEASLAALRNGQADMLILAKEYYEGGQKEEMVKLAVRHGCKIETVEDNYTLNQYGGVGCLLRYRSTD
jgi:hypothetical protein